MTETRDHQRRRFLRTTLNATAMAVACRWVTPAVAAASGRAVVGFQLPPTGDRFLTGLLGELHTRYQPDLGTTPVVMPGASGRAAVEAVAASARDGATVLIAPSTVLTLAPVIYKMPVDPATTLIPVAGTCIALLGFFVGPAVPAHVATMADYVQWVRMNPQWNGYGVPGLGTATNYVGAEVSRLADVPLRVVSYKGFFALSNDIVAGSIAAGVLPLPGVRDLARHPQMRLLAVTGDQRLSTLPDVPTLRESGLAEDFPTESLGVFLPTGTPDQKVQELAAAIGAAVRSPAVTDALLTLGMYPMPVSGESYAVALAKERAMWKTLVAQHNFTGQS